MFGKQVISFSPASSTPEEVLNLLGATIIVDKNDFVGVRIAGSTLADDFGKVTDGTPSSFDELSFENAEIPASGSGEVAIIVGSIESSQLIRALVSNGQLDISMIQGKWEAFQISIVDSPAIIPGYEKALVIFYSWYWWADVPPKKHSRIYALETTLVSGGPSVRYRGLFINDEAPVLTELVVEKFGIFELLLRLKANYLWPAMWPGHPGSSFFVDDLENQKTADEYGIVMSTSHHEPMQRASNEWFAENPEGSWDWIDNKEKITEFFRHGIDRAKEFESYFTLGMRGEYDVAMKNDDPATVISDVIRTQRKLFLESYDNEDAVPQVLALYKEVQEYWDEGRLQVPDDITLLFADDNYGSLRRLPTLEEGNRKGGAGYVGVPRSYKWINPNSLGKTWHQLQEAYRRNARQIWIFNVGDIKPMELPLTFGLTLAWDINSIKADTIPEFFETLGERIFGERLAQPIAHIWLDYDRLVSLRRHEHIEAEQFSLLHYNEADSILCRWQALLDTAEKVDKSITDGKSRVAFFELVLFPVKASAIFVSLQINLARNRLWGEQRRNSANRALRKVLDDFEADFNLAEEFHSLLDGKWRHIVRQPHYILRDSWQTPIRDMVGGLCFVQTRQNSSASVGQLGVAVEGHEGVRPGRINEASDLTHPSRRYLIPGLTLPTMTTYGPASVWFDVPIGFNETVTLDVRSAGGNYGQYGDDFEQIHLPVLNRQDPGAFTGFLETAGFVSIPATKACILHGYRILPYVGRLLTGVLAIDPEVLRTTKDSELPFASYDTLYGTIFGLMENILRSIDCFLRPESQESYLLDGTMQFRTTSSHDDMLLLSSRKATIQLKSALSTQTSCWRSSLLTLVVDWIQPFNEPDSRKSHKEQSAKGAKSSAPSDTITDPRFAAFATDPRFRLPSKKHTRTKIDKRFSRMLEDDDFSNTATVDRYGRKISSSGKKKALQRLYVPEEAEDDEEEGSEPEPEVEDDVVVEKELRRAEAGYDPARGGGFSSSEEEDESEIEEDEETAIDSGEAFPDLAAEQTAVPMGEVTKRIAVVNLDWDNIRAVDLYSVFASFVSGSGRIEHLAVYQSEYGKERMEREEMEGPPKEIFARQKAEEEEERDSEEDTEDEEERIKQDLLKPDDGEEFDSGALRQYQLERLRYFYAVITFSDAQVAHRVYEATDGTEYLTSANFFDLRFVPDDTEFDDVPRDECSAVPEGYRPTDFVTDALQHSKVKLTWDADDVSRKDTLNKAFSGSRAEIGENDLRAYLGSDSSEAESEGEEEVVADDVPKLTKKEAARQKMRAALGLGDEPVKSKKVTGPVGDMQITFTAGLSTTEKDDGGVFLNKPIIEETTAEAYIRKEKERKARRKEKAKATREGRDVDAEVEVAEEGVAEPEADLGFDDPFFATDEKVKSKAASDLRKAARAKKHAEKKELLDAAAEQKKELELLMTEGIDEGGSKEHFDINEIVRAEKAAKRGGKRGRKGKSGEVEDRKGALQKGFEMDVADPRFGALFESHEFAIDTSNPKYKATEGMKKLLEEGRRKRKGDEGEEGEERVVGKKRRKEKASGEELGRLVDSVKKKLAR
ncbi:pre-rRNA-processing protein esf1 [Pseudogymnoascus australis]